MNPTVRIIITAQTTALASSGNYTDRQQELSDMVLDLRDCSMLTFKQIATALNQSGVTSPTGLMLTAELVFSIYKQRLRRDVRLLSPAMVRLVSVGLA